MTKYEVMTITAVGKMSAGEYEREEDAVARRFYLIEARTANGFGGVENVWIERDGERYEPTMTIDRERFDAPTVKLNRQCYDKAGRPITDRRWSKRLEDPNYKRVAFDKIADYEVSTIWMGRALPGMDERMIFDSWVSGEHVSFNQFYKTEKAAERGHAALVERIKAGDIDPEWSR